MSPEDHKGGTPDDAAKGGGTQDDVTGDQKPDETVETDAEKIARLEAENAAVKAKQAQWLPQKTEYERLLADERERQDQPPTDARAQGLSETDEESEETAALERAAAHGDAYSKALLRDRGRALVDRQLNAIADPKERADVQQFHEKYKNRFGTDVVTARWALRGLQAEQAAKTAADTKDKPKPKDDPPKPKPPADPPDLETGRHSGGGGSDDKKPMPLSQYKATLARGGPVAIKLRDDKDEGLVELDYSK